MFSNLAAYLFGSDSGVENRGRSVTPERDVRLTAVMADGDEDWLLVDHCDSPIPNSNRDDRDSEGDTDISSSMESIPNDAQLCIHPLQSTHPLLRITRTSSTSSLPCTNFEESWFITPPPCFTSAGPVNMETSPLENLLIEHPSMSVYQHSQPALVSRRHNSAPSSADSDNERIVAEVEVDRLEEIQDEIRVVRRRHRRAPAEQIRQQERQGMKIKNAQKVQIQKACQSLKRSYFERNNKAREVNCRNHRQRRGERSQGLARSNANNNRKC